MNSKQKIQKLERAYKKFQEKMAKLAERQQNAISKAIKKIEQKQIEAIKSKVK